MMKIPKQYIENMEKIKKEYIEDDTDEITIKDTFFQKVPLGIIKNNKIIAKKRIEKNKNYILIVLESPHKDEYKELVPIAPAQGTTGDRIKLKLPIIKKIVETIKKINKFEVIIINPVPYQTSLYSLYDRIQEPKDSGNIEPKDSDKIDQKLKSFVWKQMWCSNYKNCKTEFKKNIERISPVYIFNCCTSEFKEDISKELEGKSVFDLSHPSSSSFLATLDGIDKYMQELENK